MKDLYQVIKAPVITEKSTAQASQGKCTFKVEKRASKREIKRAVEKLFNVAVLDVATANVRGDWKRAVVTLKEGDKIELFDLST